MQNGWLISSYSVSKRNYNVVHSAGPEIYFDNPCIGYVKKGYARFLHRGNVYYAYEGDLIYISSETKYQSVWFGSPDIEFYSIDFMFKLKSSFSEYGFQILKSYPSELPDKIYRAYENSRMLSVSYFYLLLDDVYGRLEPSCAPSSFGIIEPAVEYIEANYSHDISIKELAALCHCSESGFFRLFKRATGVTPVTYKHNIMIQHALDMLSHTALSVEEISVRTGFSSSNYFRTVFFKLTGKTPKELRR